MNNLSRLRAAFLLLLVIVQPDSVTDSISNNLQKVPTMLLHKEYYHIEGSKYIKFYVTFNKQTISTISYQPKKIGYQVTAVPVEKDGFFESSGALTGFNDCLLEIERPSAKRLAAALKILDERRKKYLEFFGIKQL